MQKSDIASRRRALKTELKRVVNELKKAGVERIILFGSLAKDDIGHASEARRWLLQAKHDLDDANFSLEGT